MARILGTCIGVFLLVALAFPFVRDAYHRYHVISGLEAVMNERDRAAFREWKGDAISFGRSLFERCELMNGRGAAVCQSYLTALE